MLFDIHGYNTKRAELTCTNICRSIVLPTMQIVEYKLTCNGITSPKHWRNPVHLMYSNITIVDLLDRVSPSI